MVAQSCQQDVEVAEMRVPNEQGGLQVILQPPLATLPESFRPVGWLLPYGVVIRKSNLPRAPA